MGSEGEETWSREALAQEWLTAARFGEKADVDLILDYCDAHQMPSLVGYADDARLNTALHMAAGNGHHELVAYLIELGESVHSGNAEGNTALHWAALNGHEETVKALLAAGASPNVKNHAGKTPLFEAQMREHEAIVTLLSKDLNEEEEEEENDEADKEAASKTEAPNLESVTDHMANMSTSE